MDRTPEFQILRYSPSLWYVSGELDVVTHERFAEAIASALADGGPVVFDMTAVSFMDSTAIGAMIRAVRAADTGCLILHGVRDSIRRTLEIIGVRALDRIHVNACGSDPYPRGHAVRDGDGSADLVRRLAEIRSTYEQLVRRETARVDRARAMRRDAVATRTRVRAMRGAAAA